MTRRFRHGQSGLSSVEMITGGLVIVIICLALLDLGVVVLASTIHDGVVKNVARAAANQQSAGTANAAAQRALSSFAPSPVIAGINLKELEFNKNGSGLVRATTHMQVRLPVPVPGYEIIDFDAAAAEPCVGIREQGPAQ